MKIVDKICKKQADIYAAPAVTIALLGDSVTQGCFECFTTAEDKVDTVFDADCSYGSKLKSMLNLLYPKVTFNVINAGISGQKAKDGLKRLDRDVLPYHPDLVVVAFALNDATEGLAGLKGYEEAMSEIIRKVRAQGAECIVLTPNMMNTSISDQLKEKPLLKFAKTMKDLQESGMLDRYAEKARTIAEKEGAVLCDVYAKWKKMAAAGVNVTDILANKLNHPIRAMHYLTAMMLCDCILG